MDPIIKHEIKVVTYSEDDEGVNGDYTLMDLFERINDEWYIKLHLIAYELCATHNSDRISYKMI